MGWSLSNRGDEVSMCHFKGNLFSVEIHIFVGIGGPKMVLKFIQNESKMDLK